MEKLFLCSSFKDVAPLFEEFIKSDLVGKRVSFIPTASLVEEITFYVEAGKRALEKMGLIVDILDISTATTEEISSKLQHNDFIYVTGGNTFFLLQEMQKSGADNLIREQITAGKIYIGESAGAMILSPNIEYVKLMDSIKKAPDLHTFSALNVVNFYPVPHYTNFPFVKSVEKIITKYQDILNLYPITNKQAILVEGGNKKIIAKG
ncbi:MULTISPECIES: peptidase E [Capnocytophaga]|uniref:Peptidase S51 n=2 Tax=Capnocytophaga TaxID=1016 RepID=A0A286NU14_9FLAO|nr:Type 1 glutamine amidotransferase-like domain-containing protein [Capnocytophaga cynodegmi]ATA67643.1 peptidase S51 [Capnocytophaga cynodegmi]